MYLGFQGLRALIQRLPLEAARGIGRGLGAAAYAVLGAQRRLTLEHLRFAFGQQWSDAQRRLVARGVFWNLGQTAMEWLRLPVLSNTQLQQLITCEGLDHLRQALAGGNGAIVMTAHFGNWELISPYFRTLGFEGGVLARRLRYPEYESFLIDLRGSRGIHTFARGSLKDVAKVLRANQIVGMLSDQDMDSLEGIFVNFFGHPTYTPIGPAALSLMTGAPIIPCFIIREGGRFRLRIEPPLRAPQGMDRSQAMAALTQAWSDVIEAYIRRYPDHWVWMHRRWKTQPKPAHRTEPTADSAQQAQQNMMEGRGPQLALSLCAVCCALCAAFVGCAKSGGKPQGKAPAVAAVPDPNAAQQMSGFILTGYEPDGTKRWVLNGKGASVDGHIVSILHPDAVGNEPGRTAFLTASAAQINQDNRHVRMEHEVTIHTSDGLWLTSPILHWLPDRNEVATDQAVRIETDHMLVRGYEAEGLTQLKHAKILRDIEMVLNPSDHDRPNGGSKQVTITCDGPLSFDYEHNVATFEENVHVKDPNGDLYSDKLVAYLDPKAHTIRYAEAMGRVRIHQNQNTALSERAVYEPAAGKITLIGKPSLLVYPSQGNKEGVQLSFGGLTSVPGPTKEPKQSHPTESAAN